jgi:hypothetical protein
MDNQPLNEDLFRDADYDTDDEEVELEADAIPDSTTLTAPTETPDDAETETETPVGAADSKPVVYAKLPHLPIIKPNRNMVAQSCKIWGCSCQVYLHLHLLAI